MEQNRSGSDSLFGSDEFSYDYGRSEVPLIGRSVGDHLRLIARAHPHKECLVSVEQNIRLTYSEVVEKSDQLAAALLSYGIERGDRVGIWSTNNYEWFVIFFAVARIGAILVNVNPGYKSGELEYALNQSGTRLLFTIEENRGSNYMAMLEDVAGHLFDSSSKAESKVRGLEQLVIIAADVNQANRDSKSISTLAEFISNNTAKGSSSKSLDAGSTEEKDPSDDESGATTSGLSVDALKYRAARVQIDDPVNIQYTSGTTGHPKGVTLSHHNLLNNAYLAAVAMKLGPESRFCIPMPFYHCGGMISSALATLVVGGTVVIPSPFFVAKPTLSACQNERCTHMSGVPTMFIAQLEEPDFSSFDLTSMKGGFMAGAPCPVRLMRRVADEMSMPEVVILYGLTESAPLMTATTVEDSLEIRATTVGRIIPGIEIKIIDPESGEIVGRGAQGEICCRGHNVMLGYWQNEDATRDTIDSAGWLHSGDLGTMSPEGYINITGRKKDMICRGGENVYPREIEEVLHSHPSISQAQVFGIPDDHLGEEVAMWVQLKAGQSIDSDELKLWLRERIAHFKVPRHIKVVSEFPMTVTGKIRKFVMRDHMIDELGLKEASEIETA